MSLIPNLRAIQFAKGRVTRIEPLPDSLAVISLATIEECTIARDRLRQAREELQYCETKSSVVDGCVNIALRHPLDSLGNFLPIAGHVDYNDGDTAFEALPTPSENGEVPGALVALDGDVYNTIHHPLAPRRAGDHMRRALLTADRALALLDIACDPARRLPVDELRSLRDRLFAVGAWLHSAANPNDRTRTIKVWAPNHDTPMRAAYLHTANALPGAIIPRSEHIRSNGFDLIPQRMLEIFQDGLRPVLAVHIARPITPIDPVDPHKTRIKITLHAPNIQLDPNTGNAIDLMRFASNLPEAAR